MSMEAHNQTMFKGMSDHMYRTIDREVRSSTQLSSLYKLLSPLMPDT